MPIEGRHSSAENNLSNYDGIYFFFFSDSVIDFQFTLEEHKIIYKTKEYHFLHRLSQKERIKAKGKKRSIQKAK